MSQDQAKQFLLQGIEAAQAGQKDRARQFLQNALRLAPQNETAWLWMSSVARDNRERLFCLQSLLQINPENQMALKAVRAMGVDPQQLLQQQERTAATSQTGASAASVPGLSGERLNGVIQAADLFVRNYRAIPFSASEQEWNLKDRLRYGEAAAIRRRTIRYAAMGGAVAIVALVLIVLVASFLSSQGGTQISRRPTATRTFTPTHTATATPGVTSTPSPPPANPLPSFVPPEGLQRGDIYGGTPTPFYPPVPSGRGQEFQNAVALYSIGEYDQAIPIFEAERQSAQGVLGQCVPETYYYHILSLAEQGGRQNLNEAELLVGEAANSPGCEQDMLIATGGCLVNYLQGLENNDPAEFLDARNWCDSAISQAGTDRVMVLAATTNARLYLLEGDYQSAASVLNDALGDWPADLNLLLVRARVELARGDLRQALHFIEQALYVDPVSEQALRLRVEAYVQIAAQTTERQEQIQLYGTAVTWAQNYLIFHPGEPAGYLLLGQARMGEGNGDLAEIALSRIIEAEDSLPDDQRDVIQQAHRLRADLYEQQFQLEDALEDIEYLLESDSDNLELIERQADLAYRLGQYTLAREGITILLEEIAADEEAEPRIDLQLRLLEITTQICEFDADVDCDYEAALEVMDDNFLFELEDADEVLARSYRAKAQYHVTMEADEDDLSQFQRDTAYQQALDDIETALEVNETALDQYYRGLILEQLDNPEEALLAYEWVDYWSQFYDYPFIEDVQDRIEELRPPEEEDDEDS